MSAGMRPEEARAAFAQAYDSGDLDEAVPAACTALLCEQAAEFRDGVPLLDLYIEPAEIDGAPAVAVQIGRDDACMNVVLDLATLRRAVEADGAFPCLGFLAWSAFQQRRQALQETAPRRWAPHRIGNGRPPPLEDMRQAHYVRPERDRQIERQLGQGGSVLLVGRPASGKTTSATMAASTLRGQGIGLVWLDLADPADGVESLLVTLLTAPWRKAYLVVVDNLQANISVGNGIFPAVDWLREDLGLTLQVLATGWGSIGWSSLNLPSQLVRIRASGREIIGLLATAARLSDDERAALFRLAKDDLVLATAALRFHRDHRRMPVDGELVGEVARGVGAGDITDETTRWWLYWFACLGIFEIDVNEEQSAQIVPPDVSAFLLQAGLIQRNDESLTIGHPSLAKLLTRYARSCEDWSSHELPSPARASFEYLQRAEERHVLAMLKKLELSGSGPDNGSSGNLATHWHRLTVLGNLITEQTLADPSWGGDTTTAANAGMALALHPNRRSEEFVNAWVLIAKQVRSWWDYEYHHEPTPAAGHAEEPFIGIEDALSAEDVLESRLDIDRCHRMWVFGLLLDFEATAPLQEPERWRTLVTNAKALINGFGFFYPRNLPWITAAILYGLLHDELPFVYEAGTIADTATAWLHKEVASPMREHGIADQSANLSAAAICMLALLNAGRPVSDPYIERTGRYLWEKRAVWMRPGRESEAALVVDALLRAEQHVEALHEAVFNLLEWVTEEERWESGPQLDDPEERLRIRRDFTRVAARMASVVPALVYRRLEALLEEFDRSPDEETAQAPPGSAAGAAQAERRESPAQAHGASQGTASEPAAAAPGGEGSGAPAAPPPAPLVPLPRLRQRVAWISRHIQDNTISRENALSSVRDPEAIEQMNARLFEWYEHKEECDRIERSLTETTSPDIIRQLDDLGRRTLGHAWTPLLGER